MTFSCFGCGQQVQYGETKKDIRNEDNSQHVCDKHLRNNRQYTSTSSFKADAEKERNNNIREAQQLKQTHEKQIIEQETANAKLIAESNNNIASALSKIALRLNDFFQLKRLEEG